MIARIKAKYGRVIFVVIGLLVLFSYSQELAYIACAIVVVLLLILWRFTENGRNASQKIKVWNLLQKGYGCENVPDSHWCSGTGCVGELAYYFSAIVNGSGIYIRNDEAGDGVVFFGWDKIAQIKRFSLQHKPDEYFIRVLFVNDMSSIGVPWHPSFDGFVPSKVGYLIK